MTQASFAPRILIADDDPNIRALLKDVLESYGATVKAVCDGHEAVTEALLQRYDACVLDVEMPVKNGIDACRELRSMAFTKRLPILILTGLLDETTVKAAFAAGAGDYLSKPVHAVLLWRRVCNLIELHNLEDSKNDLAAIRELADEKKSVTPLPR